MDGLGRLDLALLASLAKVEAQKIGKRTKARMARAKAKGIRIGRPKINFDLRQKIADRAARGETVCYREGAGD
jgi:DNA invertase Pin-like site-specific DNA recombinase